MRESSQLRISIGTALLLLHRRRLRLLLLQGVRSEIFVNIVNSYNDSC
jgi:hypothetical protein